MNTVDATVVANKLLELSGNPEKDNITQLKLIKLVYISHGWMLGLYGRPLIDNRIEAWRYGPVIPSIRKIIRKYGDRPITKVKISSKETLDHQQEDLIEQIHKAYGQRDGLELSAMTHREGTPWYSVWHEHQAAEGDEIPDDIIKLYYERLIANA